MESYAYNEEKMLESIAAFRKGKPGRPKRKNGCRIHGNANMRQRPQGWMVCRICTAAHSRKNYAKNGEKIKAHKRAKAQLEKAA